jgi:hypothetical protein
MRELRTLPEANASAYPLHRKLNLQQVEEQASLPDRAQLSLTRA